jgi:ribosomal protein L37E
MNNDSNNNNNNAVIICNYCGKENNYNNKYCSECGSKLIQSINVENNFNQQNNDSDKRNGTTTFINIVCDIAIVFAFILTVVYKNPFILIITLLLIAGVMKKSRNLALGMLKFMALSFCIGIVCLFVMLGLCVGLFK